MKRIKIDASFLAMVCILGWLELRLCLWVLLGILCHEAGHLAALMLCRVPIHSIRFSFGGAVIQTAVMRYSTEVVCAMAGPVAGLIAAAVSLRLQPDFALISACLSLVNLLPLYPLDGGRVLAMLLSQCDRGERILSVIAGITCCSLMVLACWLTAVMQAGLWPIFLALLALWRAGSRKNSCFSARKPLQYRKY